MGGEIFLIGTVTSRTYMNSVCDDDQIFSYDLAT